MSHSPSTERTYHAPSAPVAGQVYLDSAGGVWKVRRLTVAENPVGFYLVHLAFGPSASELSDSMILGPHEFAALVREQDLRPHLHSV